MMLQHDINWATSQILDTQLPYLVHWLSAQQSLQSMVHFNVVLSHL